MKTRGKKLKLFKLHYNITTIESGVVVVPFEKFPDDGEALAYIKGRFGGKGINQSFQVSEIERLEGRR